MILRRFLNIILILAIIEITIVAGYFIFRTNQLTQNQNNEQPSVGQIPLNTFRVAIYAFEKDGGHIFDGAIIAVIEKVSGKIVAEQVADQNGQTVFYLNRGFYRFQPSPIKENRVVGFLEAEVRESEEFTLHLIEIGPAAFGAPVRSCEAKQEAINLAFEQVNYCEINLDCKFFQPSGFCWAYVNSALDNSVISQRIQDYGKSCTIPEFKCIRKGKAICVQHKCTNDYQ